VVQGKFLLCLRVVHVTLYLQDGKPLPNDERFKLGDSAQETSLEITNVLAQDAGIYECGKSEQKLKKYLFESFSCQKHYRRIEMQGPSKRKSG
jgi:hypothetical protein